MRKKIGIKYCGGCNPSYERIEMIQQVQSLLKDRFISSIHDQKASGITILVSGCPRACADKKSNDFDIPSQSIVGENDFKSLID